MQQHRANPVCASCHARMDPLGFALENFDATGQWRTMEAGAPIDASADLPDGTRFEGPGGLRKMLLGQSDQVATATTEKLLTYALGRGLGYYDLRRRPEDRPLGGGRRLQVPVGDSRRRQQRAVQDEDRGIG